MTSSISDEAMSSDSSASCVLSSTSVEAESSESADSVEAESSESVDSVYLEAVSSVEAESAEMSNSSSEDMVTDKLFQACDHTGQGKVRVSDLVDYLKTIVDGQLHVRFHPI